jgi:hypothetical protein
MGQQKGYVPKWRHDKRFFQAFHGGNLLDLKFLNFKNASLNFFSINQIQQIKSRKPSPWKNRSRSIYIRQKMYSDKNKCVQTRKIYCRWNACSLHSFISNLGTLCVHWLTLFLMKAGKVQFKDFLWNTPNMSFCSYQINLKFYFGRKPMLRWTVM